MGRNNFSGWLIITVSTLCLLLTVNVAYSDEYFTLQVDSGYYVCAENGGGGDLIANRLSPSKWETFKLIRLDGGLVAIQTHSGHYLCAEHGGGSLVVANRKEINKWEKFKIIEVGENKIAIQVNSGQYWCAENGGNSYIYANRTWINLWETFKIEYVDP